MTTSTTDLLLPLLSWTNPVKSVVALVGVNVALWTLSLQRPLYILPLILLLSYLRFIWQSRIRGTVLVDPPDHEDWVTLASYDLQAVTKTKVTQVWRQWVQLREKSHFVWTTATCTFWMILAKIGMELDSLSLLFLLVNAAFLVVPVLDLLPTIPVDSPVTVEVRSTTTEVSYHHTSSSSSSIATPSSPFYDFYEGVVTRSMAARSLLAANSFSSSVNATLFMNDDGRRSPSPEEPESLSPSIPQMPDPSEITPGDASDGEEDDFLFDAKHFDKSSSSTSVSTSFEIVDEDLSNLNC